MSTITYDTASRARSSRVRAAAIVAAARRKGFLARLLARFIAAREQRAMEEIRRHGILLPHELEQAGWKLNERSEDSLPFVR